MKIIDLNGFEIEVTDLDEAINITPNTRNTGTKTNTVLTLTKGKKPIGWI